MCGIVGFIQSKPTLSIVHTILKRLEQRGYDSWGYYFQDETGTVSDYQKFIGPISQSRISDNDIYSTGILHTRWATTGEVNFENTHPVKNGNYYCVLNGIVDNYIELQKYIESKGYELKTNSDTEVIPALLNYASKFSNEPKVILCRTRIFLKGNYAFLAISPKYPNTIFAACNGSPIYITNNGLVSSDIQSLSGFATKCFKLKDNDRVIITPSSLLTFDYDIDIPQKQEKLQNSPSIKLSEIQQQVDVKIPTLLFNNWDGETKYDEVVIFGCGSSYYAGLLSQFFIEELIKTRCTICYSSDLQYHNLSLYSDKTLFIGISQSGETFDTLQILKKLKSQNKSILVITNNQLSQAAMLSKNNIYLDCGTEYAVASTKTFTSTVLSLLNLCSENLDIKELIKAFKFILSNTKEIEKWANVIKDYNHVLFLARYINFPIACEAALKMKEISYIHAEAILAAEIKHGPLALIDDKTFSIFILGGENKGGQENVFNNINEVKARNGKCLIITNEVWEKSVRLYHNDVIVVPIVDKWLQPLTFLIVVQLLAYYCAILKGLNADRPRNLAKTITTL